MATPVNLHAVERAASGLLGAGCIFAGVRRRTLGGLLLAAAGASLLYRGAAGHCPLYEQLDLATTRRAKLRGVAIRRAITIQSSPEDLYRAWRDLERLPEIFPYLESVRAAGDQRSHWIARLGRARLEWDAELLDDQPGRRIVWRTRPGGDWDHDGVMELREAPRGRGTELHVWLRVRPRGGVGLLRVRPLLRRLQRFRLGDELRRFKQLMETGEIATNALTPPARSAPRATLGAARAETRA